MKASTATAFGVCLAALVTAHCTNERQPTPAPSASIAEAPSQPSPLAACQPTPVDAANPIAGCWNGTFDTSDPGDCHTNTPATATFAEDGPNVTGTLTAANACGLEAVSLVAMLRGDHVEGTLTRGTITGQVVGTLTNDTLELITSDLRSGNLNSVIPAGRMHLHR